jgi:hypothetical protein
MGFLSDPELLGVVVLVPQILPIDRVLGHAALYRAGAP